MNDPTNSTLRLSAASVCHVGKLRIENQDRVELRSKAGLFVLADGMGGHDGGGKASQIAVDAVMRSMESGTEPADAVLQANAEVHRASEEHARFGTMGTTVVAARIAGQFCELAWVGDSRAYLLGHEIKQLTTDHSVVQQWVDQGDIAAAEARNHPRRNVLTRALGGKRLTRDQIGSARVRFSDEHQLLLTSDGLHGLLTDDEMREIIQESDGLQAAVNGLFDLAMERGGTDNISAILVAHAHAPDLIEA